MAIIDKPSDYFNTVLHAGTGSEQTVTGVGFEPDLTWIKSRSNGRPNVLADSVRGAAKQLLSNATDTETTYSQYLKSFNSDGFVLGTDNFVNENNQTFVSWNWKEQTGVFDIVSFTGNGSARTISHSLGSVPTFYVVKSRGNATSWACYHKALGNTKIAGLWNDTSLPEANANFFNNTTPTSSVFSVGNDATLNGNGRTFIVYLFGDTSMSKMGNYIGNGNANGTFVYTGFKPAYVMLKLTSDAQENWSCYDTARNPINGPNDGYLTADTVSAANTNTDDLDMLGNGFKLNRAHDRANTNGYKYMYLAFAENPFVTSTGIPANAR